jgi:hypothetical protein
MNSETARTSQAVHRTSPADRARRDAATEQRSSYLHAVGMMPRAFHLLRAMFATGPRVQPLEEVRSRPCILISRRGLTPWQSAVAKILACSPVHHLVL